LIGVNVGRIRVGQREPLLADSRDLAAGALEDVFVVEEVSTGLEIVWAGDIHRELARGSVNRRFFTRAIVSPPRLISY
jgi:hypothetical protein